MKDSDNSEFLSSKEIAHNQLSFKFDVLVEDQRVHHKKPHFEKFLLALRQETKDIIAIANANGGNYQDMKAIPNNELRLAVDEYDRRNNIVRIEVIHTPSYNQTAKPFKPWSKDRKHRERIRKMMDRVHKKYAIPEMLVDAVLNECFKNIQYFGLCLLPEASDRCDVRFDAPSVIAARAKELEIRQKEYASTK